MADQDHSLYVGDLSKEVNERTLYEHFRKFGDVTGVNVCRDAFSKESLGYAYVNFKDRESAEKAKNELNCTDIAGKSCRIMWVIKDPETRKAGKGNIFIRNLHPSITNKDLYKTFSQLGTLLSCKVATDMDGNSKGFGYVHFADEDVANAAIEKVDGQVIEGMTVSATKFIPRREREAFKNKSWTNVFVKDLPESVDTDDKLAALFAECGEIKSPKLMLDGENNSKGFGFVNFADHEGAQAAVTQFHGVELEGKTLYVSRAQKKSERRAILKKQHDQRKRDLQQKYQGRNLYIKNLDDNITKDDLDAAFGEYGPITSSAIMKDEKGFSKGFGFVCYETKESATAAIENMRNRTLPGSKKLLFVALHEPREQRNRRMQQNKKLRKQQHLYTVPMYGPRAYYPPYAVPPQQPRMPMAQPMPVQTPSFSIPSLQQLEQMPEEELKTVLGEAFYHRIHQIKPQEAQKITGMLLNADWPLQKKWEIINDDAVLATAVDRASAVLKQQNAN